MNLAQLFASAFRALRSNLLRTALTMLGIVIGIASVILIIALGQGATESITSQVSSLGTNLIFIQPGKQIPGRAPQSSNTLTYDDASLFADRIKNPDITSTTAIVQTNAEIVANGESKSTAIQGVDADYASIGSLDMDQGEFISQEDTIGLSRVAVLGPEVVSDLFGEGANPVGQTITIKSHSFRVVGVTKAKGSSGFTNPDASVYIPVTTAMKVLLGQNYVSAIELQVGDPKKVDQAIESVSNSLMDKHKITNPDLADFTVRSSKDALSTLNSITGVLTGMLAGIAAISLVVGGIGIMNIMLVTVTERTREIGLSKAIGAKNKDILTQFLIEAIVLTLSGGIVGMILGIALDFVITRFLPIPFIVQPSAIFLAVSVSTVVGVVFGLYPANQAAKLSPIEALRYE